MTTPAIPEELMEEAHDVAFDCDPSKTSEQIQLTIARALHAAVLKEREACAVLAKEWRRKRLAVEQEYFDPCGRWEREYLYEDGKDRDLIAAAIRSRGDA